VAKSPGPIEDAVERGITAFNERDWTTAFALLSPLAEQGEPKAMFWLGNLHRFGFGAPSDLPRAWELILEAARRGHEPAREQVINETINFPGRKLPLDYEAAGLLWVKEDVAAGKPQAQLRLGLGLLHGFGGLAIDEAEGLRLLELAAEQDYAPAQSLLGSLYGAYTFGKPDYPRSLAWLRRAADNGFISAQSRLGWIYEKGENGAAVDFDEARAWYRKGGAGGDLLSSVALARMHERGLGGEKDPRQALLWRAQAAALGDYRSALKVARALVSGRIAQRDYVQAYALFSLAALRDERRGSPDLTKSTAARDKLGERLTPDQLERARDLVDRMKVRFIGDG
jgi:uncharacterized protein